MSVNYRCTDIDFDSMTCDEKLMHFDWLMRVSEWVDLAAQLPEGVRWE